jgi:hypothetical protein
MGKRSARIAVLTLLVLAAAAASLFIWRVEDRLAALSSSRQTLGAHIGSIRSAAIEMGAAQQSYVAPGQLDQAWFERTSLLFDEMRRSIAALPPLLHAGDAPAQQALDASIDLLVETDTRARQNLELGEDLMAADVIYSDGRSVLDGLRRQLDGIERAEDQWYSMQSAELARQRWLVLGAAASLFLVGTLVLALGGARPHTVVSPPPIAAEPSPAAPAPEPAREAPDVDLSALATVCQELASVTSAPALVDALGYAAGLVNASGVVLWTAHGEYLCAAIGYGYTQEHVARFGPIVREADNAVARAWRTRTPSVVPGDRTGAGALVVPIVSSDGCTGALAFETLQGFEQRPHVQAVASVVAAQVAALPLSWPAAAAPVEEGPSATIKSA